jgi:phospholipid/cholesterol/gamma-HCH transport system substrate-binding protein
METEEIKQNIKLGAFVLTGIVLFAIAVLFIGKQSVIFNRTFTVSAIFKNVEGLKDGDNVWLSGVKIGTVKNVRIISEGKVIVDLSLKDRQNQFVTKDATASIGSDGFVGNKIVIIKPGVSRQAVHDSDTISAFSPTDTQELFNLAKDVGANTRTITDDLKVITAKLNKGEGIVGELLHEGELSLEVRQLINSLKMASQNTNQATAGLKRIVEEFNNGDGLMTKLLMDSNYVKTFDSTLTSIAHVGENSRVISEDLREMIDKMNSEDNAIGVLLADTTFANKLRVTLDNAESASAKLDDNMEALKHNFLLRGYFRKQERAADKNE